MRYHHDERQWTLGGNQHFPSFTGYLSKVTIFRRHCIHYDLVIKGMLALIFYLYYISHFFSIFNANDFIQLPSDQKEPPSIVKGKQNKRRR